MICAYEKVPVPPEEQAKGFELEDRKYILVDPVELEAGRTRKQPDDRSPRIRQNRPDRSHLPRRVYYLEPDTLSKGYNALVGALQEMEVAGICTWTMRKRSYFGALQASGKILRLNTLRYADEVISVKSLDLQEIFFV